MNKFGIREKRTILKAAVVGSALFAIDFTRDLLGAVFRFKPLGVVSIGTIFGVTALLYLLGQYKNWW